MKVSIWRYLDAAILALAFTGFILLDADGRMAIVTLLSLAVFFKDLIKSEGETT